MKSNGHSQCLASFRGVLSTRVNAAWQIQFVLEHIQLCSFDMERSWGEVTLGPSLPARKTRKRIKEQGRRTKLHLTKQDST